VRRSLLPRQSLLRCAHATGCVAGIGKSLAQKLALQGLNVVLVALDVRALPVHAAREPSTRRCAHLRADAAPPQEPLLNETAAELQAAFPKQQFRKASSLLSRTSQALARSRPSCVPCRWASTLARQART
jgi:NAD(P)-dependent dehydrogenase (short-subunit alcohol dehydrogenase family)